MRTTRLITALLAAAGLAGAVMAGPAGAAPADTHDEPNGWNPGTATVQGSTHSDKRKADMFVLTPDLGLGDATTQSPARPTRPANPEPITASDAVVNAPDQGLDWASAGIGAAAGIGAFAIALAVTGGLRRQRTASPDL